MSIGPIDLNIMVNQTTNVHRIADEGVRNNEEQAAFSQHMQQEVQHEQQKTVQTSKSHEQLIKDGQEGNKGEYRRRKRRKEKEKENEEAKKAKSSSSIFDVSI